MARSEMTRKEMESRIRALGFTVRVVDGEIRVAQNFGNSQRDRALSERGAYYTTDRADAVLTAEHWAAVHEDNRRHTNAQFAALAEESAAALRREQARKQEGERLAAIATAHDFGNRFGGTVSAGTLRPADLIPALVDTLSDVLEWWTLDTPAGAELERAQHADRAQTRLGNIERAMDGGADYFGSESAAEDLEWLESSLAELAPAPYTFGAHEGDGADFGFWRVEDDGPAGDGVTTCNTCGEPLTASQRGTCDGCDTGAAVEVFRGDWRTASRMGHTLDNVHGVPNRVSSPGDGPSAVLVLACYADRARELVPSLSMPLDNGS